MTASFYNFVIKWIQLPEFQNECFFKNTEVIPPTCTWKFNTKINPKVKRINIDPGEKTSWLPLEVFWPIIGSFNFIPMYAQILR
jgi:hypothetical protein